MRKQLRFKHIMNPTLIGGIERRRLKTRLLRQCLMQTRQMILNKWQHLTSLFGGNHLIALPNKHGLAERVTQAIEGVTDRGLSQIEMACCGRNTAMFVDGIDQTQQIEIKILERVRHGTATPVIVM